MSGKYDIIIIGGGMTGSSLAGVLSGSGLSIAVIEAASPAMETRPGDNRGLALSLSSKNILHDNRLWQPLAADATPIKNIHVSDQRHFGSVRMSCRSINAEALGYVVAAGKLGQTLIQNMVMADNIDLFRPATLTDAEILESAVNINIKLPTGEKTISAKLIAAADGTKSLTRAMLGIETRTKDWRQTAIVSSVGTEKPHNNTAYERFTETGPIALLPCRDQRCALVYTVAADHADKYLRMDETLFLDELLTRFSYRLGRFSGLGQRKSYALKSLQAVEQIKHRVVILGNAAHTLHPNAAQGFNLGLRDVAVLAGVLNRAKQEKSDIGGLPILESYLKNREDDQQRTINFTNSLAANFYTGEMYKVIGRNLAMLATDLLPPIKHRLIRKATGLCANIN